MLTAILTAPILAAALATPLLIVAQWDFNGPSTAEVPGGPAAPNPSIGSGTASVTFYDTRSMFVGGLGSSDPATTMPPNYSWSTRGYPEQEPNKTVGVQFVVSTAGLANISISYDVQHHRWSSRYQRLQYSVDGIHFLDADVFDGELSNGLAVWFNQRTVDLGGMPGVNDNPHFAFRIVAEWESTAIGSGADAYVASDPSSVFASGGTWRFDMVTVSGTIIPEPSVVALAGCSLAALFLFRRRP